MSEDNITREFDPKMNWNSRRDDIVEDFFKPALANSVLYQRMSGYFSSTSFVYVANEILEFIDRNSRIQLVTSPNLSHIDKDMIERSMEDPEKLLSEIFFNDLKNDPDNLKINCAKLMGYMLSKKIDGIPQLEIKIAMEELYHEKTGIMHLIDGGKISFTGSNNETGRGWAENVESFKVFCSWKDDTNNRAIVHDQRYFNDLWNNNEEGVNVVDLPYAVEQHLLEISPKSDEEYKETLEKVTEKLRKKTKKPTMELFDYQKEARDAFLDKNCIGLFAMATGTGKTFAAFGCINKIQNLHERTAVIIACPQKHLVEQWVEELQNYNSGMPDADKVVMSSYVTCDSDYKNWRTNFDKILSDVNVLPLGKKEYYENNFIVFVTHATLKSKDFNEKIERIKNLKKFLIVDEVHNVTPASAQAQLRPDYDFRLGLSATPERHLDDEGTKVIFDYFDDIAYELGLEEAIAKGYLCQYDYIPFYVELTENEMDIHRDLTSQIAQIEEKKKKGTYHPKPGDFDPYLARAHLVQAAENKLEKLKEILNKMSNKLEQTLVYCTSNPSMAFPQGSPTQLKHVQSVLSARNIISDSVTWVDPTKGRRKILKDLANDHFDCVTAVRCLDEGVDIPSVKTAIFMASSGNPKQFIQRRGRVLRKSERTGKTHAEIYDILVTPPVADPTSGPSLNERKLAARELIRHKEFALIARNKTDAIESVKEITERFSIPFDDLDYGWIRNM